MPDPIEPAGEPIPIQRPGGVNPTWTASADPSLAVAAEPVAPTPVVPGPAPLVMPQPVASPPAPVDLPVQAVAPVIPPQPAAEPANSTPPPVIDLITTQPNPPAAPIPVAATTPLAPAALPPELALPDDARPFPWKPVLIGVGVLVFAGLIVGVLWWLGFLFGLPRDPQLAAVQSLAALEAQDSYHLEGSGTIRLAATTSEAASGTISVSVAGDRASTDLAKTGFVFELADAGLHLPAIIPSTLRLDILRDGSDILLQMPLLALLVGAQSDEWIKMTANGQSELASPSLTTLKPAASERIGFEQVGTKRTVHYQYRLAATELTKVLPLSPSDLALAHVPDTAQVDVHLWVGVTDRLPYQVRLTTDASDWTLTFSRFGEQLTVAKPDEAQIRSATLTSLIPGNLANLELKSRDAQRKSDLAGIKSALENYKAQQGAYPTSNGALAKVSDPVSPLLVLVGPYIARLPSDPIAEAWYGYQSDGKAYELSAVLESTADAEAVSRGDKLLFILTNGGSSEVPTANAEVRDVNAGTSTNGGTTNAAGSGSSTGRLPGN